MKYIKYLLIVIFALIAKYLGMFWFWLAVPFRKYARNVVQSYALQYGIKLKRLMERHPYKAANPFGWQLQNVHNVPGGGFIEYRKVSTIKFYIVLFLIWGWLDDDANQDTFDAGHNQHFIDGKFKDTWQAKLWRKSLIKANQSAAGKFGNTFDLGDWRGDQPLFNFPSALIWNTRNTAQNFGYLLETTCNKKRIFLHKLWKWEFGYVSDGKVDDVEYWTLVFFKNF